MFSRHILQLLLHLLSPHPVFLPVLINTLHSLTLTLYLILDNLFSQTLFPLQLNHVQVVLELLNHLMIFGLLLLRLIA